MQKSRYNATRRVLLFWTLFIGIGAIAGGVGMLVDPSGRSMGMDAMLPYFRKLPFADALFRNFVFSGIMLLLVNGATNICAAVLLLRKKRLGVLLGGVFGVTLMLWICIQFYMFPLNFMSTTYFIFGLCQALTGYAASVFLRQETFVFDRTAYTHIGENAKKLVVYFSRMGYVKRIAYEEADKIGACVYEIVATEKTDGTAGFWWCGRYGMLRRDMPIEKCAADLTKYDEVVVCSPIWVFSIAAPVRAFLRQARGKLKNVRYVFVHHTNGSYKKLAQEADGLTGTVHTGLRSVRCRKGVYKEIRLEKWEK